MNLETPVTQQQNGITRASLTDTISFVSRVMLPTFGKGILIRRPTMEAAAERFGFDTGAVKAMQRLRRSYGTGPIQLKIPGRPQLVLLHPADVMHVLQRTPRPFRADTKEKRAALNHFEPGNVLISEPDRRARLRPLHENALATTDTVHPLAWRIHEVVEEELARILGADLPELGWRQFSDAWFRIVRRVVLGTRARDDVGLTQLLDRLRQRGNWAFFVPKDDHNRRRLQEMLKRYLIEAEPDSIAARMPLDSPYQTAAQITQWLFAFDPAGMATFRTLALLASHPHFQARADQEAQQDQSVGDACASFTRRCFLEALRLWPTSPAILRELMDDYSWGSSHVSKGTGIIIFTPFFSRDDETLAFADQMTPDVWQTAHADALPDRGIVPFSGGPAICPGHNLVPMVACTAVASVLCRKCLSLISPSMNLSRLPGTLDHFGIRLGVAPRPAAPHAFE